MDFFFEKYFAIFLIFNFFKLWEGFRWAKRRPQITKSRSESFWDGLRLEIEGGPSVPLFPGGAGGGSGEITAVISQ